MNINFYNEKLTKKITKAGKRHLRIYLRRLRFRNNYYRLILRIFYNRKPNKDGTFDIMPCPSNRDAIL